MIIKILKMLIIALFISCSPKPSSESTDPADQGANGWVPVFAPIPERQLCSEAQRSRMLVESNDPTVVNCHLILEPSDAIRRPLVFRGEQSSGVLMDCNGATVSVSDGDALRIRSEMGEPVHDVTIRNCIINGSVRIWGLAINGNSPDLLESSRTLEHVSNVRDHAPYRVILEGLTITSHGRIPLYIAPGVHHSLVTNCEIDGASDSVLVYLDAETTANSFTENTLRAENIDREAIALDGSSFNTIENNSIWSAYAGGIFLYRNCGEGGVSRHSTPSVNRIIGNTIQCRYHRLDLRTDPGIWLGSRDGRRGYCGDDAGYPYGSSVSDYDFARWNVVSDNDLRDCEIELGNSTNHSNQID